MSAGRVAKKIALFEPNPLPAAAAFTGIKTGGCDSPANANAHATSITKNSASVILHRKDAIKRKKHSTSPSPNSASSTSNSLTSTSTSVYSLEEYDTANSPASSCYSSGGDSGSGNSNGQLHSLLDDYIRMPTSNSVSAPSPDCYDPYHNRTRAAITTKKPSAGTVSSTSTRSSSSMTDHDHDLELYQSSSIESDYSSNNSSNYYNQKANLANRIYNNDNNMDVGVDVPDCNSSTMTLISNAASTSTSTKKKWASKTKQQGIIKDSLMSEGRSLSLKDCYQSFSLPIVPGHLQLVEFSEIRLDSPDVDADAEDGDDEGEGEGQKSERESTGASVRNSDQYEMEPFYEELDNYSHSNGQVDAGTADDDAAAAAEDGGYNRSFLWSKGKPKAKGPTLPAVAVQNRTTSKENEVKSISSPPSTVGRGQRPPTTNANAMANGEHESESVYAEPVYNEMNNDSAGSGSRSGSNGNCNGSGGGSVSESGSASYWTPTSSMYNQSRNTLTDENAHAHAAKSESIYKTLKNSLSYSHKKQSPLPDPPTPIPCPSSSYYDMSSAELPPIPSSTGSATGKFSTIAKSAGKKLVKKLQHIRRLSKTGLESFELPSSLSIFNGIGNSATSANNSANGNQQTNTNTYAYTYAHDGISMNSSGSGSASIISHNEPKHIRTRSLSIGNISCNGISTVPSAMAPAASSSTLYSGGSNLYSGIGPGPGMKRSVSRPNIPPPLPPPLPLPNPPTNGIAGPNTKSFALPPAMKNQSQSQSQIPPDDEDDDDFDDSDFYDSDSELIRNFVAAVQPIYSMEEEPLYQYYTYGISLQPEDDYQPIIPKNLGLTLDMLVPRTGQRTLWCELPEVVSSGILTILSDKQKQLQEAIFEILTSEVSYLKSLDVLITLFYENDQLIQVLTENDRAALFGNITYVKDCAQTFLTELLSKWEKSWYIQEVGQVIHENANTRFGVYKDYCRNKPYQDKTLQRLRSTSDEFVNVVKSIEENPKCQLLQMDSFLMLPMQRITRLPLLVNAIIQRTQSPKEKCHCEDALKSLTNLVIECNEAARESQDAEETSAILEKIEFPKGTKPATNCSFGQLMLKGDFMRNPFDHQGKGGVAKINWTFQKNKRVVYWLILFTNQLLVTKKKSVDKFEVIEMASPLDANIKPLPNLEGLSKDFQHYFMLHFDRKDTVYFLAARTQSEVERWRQKLDQLKNTKELKVEAIFPYAAKRPDELSFEVGEIIRVEQMQPDGWYYGTKTGQLSSNASGVSGWFPGNYCAECS